FSRRRGRIQLESLKGSRMNSRFILALGTLALVLRPIASQAVYHLERITPVLNQPTYLTQAPGDPANILYYSTRITSAASGFSAFNSMGSIWRYDVTTRTSTVILNFAARSVVNDDGLQTFAFHPDFNTSGAPGFGKLYVASSQFGNTSLNRVEEF